MHFLRSSGNKLLFILELISTLGVATNQAGSLSMSSNNANIGGNDEENTIAVDYVVENEEIEESNKDRKISWKVQPNIVTTVSVLKRLNFRVTSKK